MVSYAMYVIGCPTVITGLIVYFPVILIRKTDKT